MKEFLASPHRTRWKSPPPAPGEDEADALLAAWRPILLLQRFIGMFFLRNLGSKDSSKVEFRWLHPGMLWSVGMCGWMCFMASLFLLEIFWKFSRRATATGNPLTQAQDFSGVMFYLHCTAMFGVFLARSRRLPRFLGAWREALAALGHHGRDLTLRRDFLIITGGILTSMVVENLLFHLYLAGEAKGTNRDEESSDQFTRALRDQLELSHGAVLQKIPYSNALALVVMAFQKFALIGFNMGDITIILMSRAICKRYQLFRRQLEKRVSERQAPDENARAWRALREDHLRLLDILQETDSFLSPLVCFSYVTNVYFIGLQLYLILSGGHRKNLELPVGTVYMAWSFVHLLTRMLLVSLTAGNIDQEAQRLPPLVLHVPHSSYCQETWRLEKSLKRTQALSGAGAFLITRSFVLGVLGAIFTLEVVLLQSTTT